METSVVGKTAIVLMASTLVALSLIGCGNDSNLQGTVLDDRETLPDFELNDQYGKLITSSDLHGSVTVLIFVRWLLKLYERHRIDWGIRFRG